MPVSGSMGGFKPKNWRKMSPLSTEGRTFTSPGGVKADKPPMTNPPEGYTGKEE